MESWWMDSYYSNSGSIVDAINNGVTVEGYDWMHDYPDGNNNYYYSYGKYQKTMKSTEKFPISICETHSKHWFRMYSMEIKF